MLHLVVSTVSLALLSTRPLPNESALPANPTMTEGDTDRSPSLPGQTDKSFKKLVTRKQFKNLLIETLPINKVLATIQSHKPINSLRMVLL
ncbi:hypothetical protein EMIT051CA3_80298 [Pseudomonas chlororaphis]